MCSRHKVPRHYVGSYILIHEALASKSQIIFQEKLYTWQFTHILITDKICQVKEAYGDHALTNYPGSCHLIGQASCDNCRKKITGNVYSNLIIGRCMYYMLGYRMLIVCGADDIWRNTIRLIPLTISLKSLLWRHNDDAMTSSVTSLAIVYSTIYSGTDERKYQSPASLAFVRRIRRRQVNSPHKGPVTRKMFSFDDVIMTDGASISCRHRKLQVEFSIASLL